jgi:hypothetical protein
MQPMRSMRAAVAVAALALGLMACGGTGTDRVAGADDVASLDTEPQTSTDGAGSTPDDGSPGDSAPDGSDPKSSDPKSSDPDTSDGDAADVDPEDAFLSYSECMRDHGVEMPDPVMVSTDGAGPIGVGGATAGQVIEINDDFDPANDEFAEASEACGSILDDAMGDIEIDPEQEAEMRAQMLDFAKCMREQGLDYPDPVFNEGGGVSMTVGAVDMDMDEFEAANKVCGEIMGQGGFSVSVAPVGAVGG